jgi:hypothetical protein
MRYFTYNIQKIPIQLNKITDDHINFFITSKQKDIIAIYSLSQFVKEPKIAKSVFDLFHIKSTRIKKNNIFFLGMTKHSDLEQSYLGSDCVTDPLKCCHLSISLGCST